MRKTQVRQLLQETLGEIVSPRGFRPRLGGFSRPIDGGGQSLSVALWDHNPHFDFTVTMGIRLDQVEALIHPFAETDERWKSETLTSLTQLEFLGLVGTPGRGVLFGGDDEASLGHAARNLAQVVEERVLTFFDSYTDLRAVEAGLNPPGAENLREPIWPVDRSRFDGSNEPYRAMHGIATAYLAGSDRLPALIIAYRGQLSQMVPEIQSKFEALAEFIQE